MKNFFAIFFLVLSSSGLSQLNEMIREAEAMPADTLKAFKLIEIGKVYTNINVDSAEYFGKMGARLSEKLDYKFGKIAANLLFGNIETYRGNYPEAKMNLQDAYRDAEKNGSYSAMAAAKMLLGNLYCKTNELDLGEQAYRDGLAICNRIGNVTTAMSIGVSLGIIKRMQGQLDSALFYYDQVMEIQLEQLHDSVVIASIYNNIGSIYSAKKEFDKMEEYVLKALEINRKMRNTRFVIVNLGNLGTLWGHEAENITKSMTYFREAVSLAKEMGAKDELAFLYNSMASVFNTNKMNDSAYHYLILSQAYKDSTFNDEKKSQMLALEQEFKTQQIQDSLRISEQELGISQANADAANEKASKTVWQLIGSIGLSVLTLIALFFVYRNAKNQKRLNKILSEKNDEIYRQKIIIEEKNTEMTDSITYAKRIQSAILPSKSEINRVIPENFVLYLPKDIVAGDFYWMERLADRVIIAVADCTGHGVPGAMVSVVCNNALNRAVREFSLSHPAEILNKTRDLVVAEFQKSGKDVKDGMDIAMVSINLDKSGKISTSGEYAGANNSLYIARKSESELIEIKADKQPIGLFNVAAPFRNHSLELKEGDCIYLSSDGFADQFGGDKRKKYKSSNFKALLKKLSENEMSQQPVILKNEFEKWRGSIEQLDDICVIGLLV